MPQTLYELDLVVKGALVKLDLVCYIDGLMAKSESKKARPNPHAQALSKLGAKKGGKARWKGIPPEERREIARRAVQARWKRAKKNS